MAFFKNENPQLQITIAKLTVNESPITATRAFVSGSHKVTTVSAATAKTDPSEENAAAVIGLFLDKPVSI